MLAFLLLMLFAFGVAVGDHANKTGTPTLNLEQLARQMGLTSFLQALKETNSLDLLTNSNGITVFMPTNEAFVAVSAKTKSQWKSDPLYHRELVRYHIINQRKDRSQLKDEAVFDTLAAGLTARFINYDGYSKNVQLYNDAEISSYDHVATNGIIHVLKNVVGHIQNDTMLGIVQKHRELSEILHAVQLANLTGVLNGSTAVTFAAPTNEAIKKLPKGSWDTLLKDIPRLSDVLRYHFASAGTWMTRGLIDNYKVETLNKKANWTVTIPVDGMVRIDKAKMVTFDLSALNGVVHTIDRVLMPST